MSQRSAAGRRRRNKPATARPESRLKRITVAMGTVILVITPISWILLHQPQSNEADASVPYVTRDDDTYLKASTKPVVARPTATTPSGTPTGTPSAGTPSPSDTPSTPGQTPTDAPSTTPTDGPTDQPTDGPTTGGPTDGPTSGTTTKAPGNPNNPTPTHSPTNTPSTTPSTTTPPPPADGGSMSAEEQELFALVDNQRVESGCSPLRRNSNLTGGARAEAEDRARTGQMASGGSSGASTGGKDMTAKAAFDRLMSSNSRTVLDCGLDELGVGQGDAKYCTTQVLVCLNTATRYAWVVDFQ
ncbi:hypothetical protein [Kribbella sp. NPDC051718]|uniref:CAP domain-containing protein n=1 Tax=Kribbella sp. NPDC051718 TaxID=3155168 RepID=UPI0034215A95